jgi:predicted MFS family arabinose efflux permease
LGISLTAASGLVTLRMIPGLAAPLLGPVADRHPRRHVMEIALALFAAAGLFLVGFGTVGATAFAFTLYGLSKVLYDPSLYAYLGDSIPYGSRGRAIGLVELSWSAAWLFGVPAAGFLIEGFGWRAPWMVLSILGVLSLILTHVGLPPGSESVKERRKPLRLRSLVGGWRDVLSTPGVIALLVTSLFLSLAIEIPFIVYGAWLESAFGLSLSTLGLASIVVGLAEASSELGTVMLTDRIGKRRSVLAGLIGMITSLLALPGLARLGLAGALAGVALVVMTFEFAIVSLLPLATQLAPQARATLVSFNLSAHALGRILGAVIGGWLWLGQTEGIALHAAAGAVCALVAAITMARGITEISV